MRLILTFFLSLLITSALTSFAQVSSGYDSQNNLNSVGQGVVSNTIRPMKAAYEGVKGTPMLMKDFSKGKLIMTNGTIYFPVLVNIDLIENEVLILKKPENQPWLISHKEISGLSIEPKSDSILFFLPVQLPGKESRFCQQLFSNDTLQLYLHQQKKIKKADFSGAYNAGKKYDEIYSEYRFYVSLNGNIKLFKPSKKVMVDLLPDREEEITDYMNSKNPDLKNPEELKLFFDILL